jgi:hypothetical protein
MIKQSSTRPKLVDSVAFVGTCGEKREQFGAFWSLQQKVCRTTLAAD